MKKFYFLFLFSLIVLFGSAQDRSQYQQAQHFLDLHGEVCFRVFTDNPKADFQKINSLVIIDKVTEHYFEVYANSSQFESYLKTGMDYQVLTPASMLHQPVMLDNTHLRDIKEWDFYPTYGEYVTLMHDFVNDYPGLCELVSIDTLESGHEILFIHINNDLTVEQDEPEFMYTSSMHGNELMGYVTMLHYIDYLLSNYGTDSRVTGLVDNIDIWIDPLANPDGAYMGGDNTVYGAVRFNAFGVDFNRNFPDPDDGPHPDGKVYQSETKAFMALADAHDFTMSANLHGGSEVINYPWDTWEKLTADDNWWRYVSRAFADTAHVYGPSGYLTALDDGVTNGYQWYTISGGRQDYMNFFKHCREVTMELSYDKTPAASRMPEFWEATYRSFLNFMEESTFGVRGVVTDARNGQALKAKIYIDGHDMDSSCVYSQLPVGDYHRLLKAGTYNITYSAKGFISQTIPVTVSDGQASIQDIQLQVKTGVMELSDAKVRVYPNPVDDVLEINSNTTIKKVELVDVSGRVVLSYTGNLKKEIAVDAASLLPGVYFVKVQSSLGLTVKKIVKH